MKESTIYEVYVPISTYMIVRINADSHDAAIKRAFYVLNNGLLDDSNISPYDAVELDDSWDNDPRNWDILCNEGECLECNPQDEE